MSKPPRKGEKPIPKPVRPIDDDDEDFDIDELKFRDDSQRTLWELLREEDVKPSDILKIKKAFEAQGKWKWRTQDATRRVRRIVDPELAAAGDVVSATDPSPTKPMQPEPEPTVSASGVPIAPIDHSVRGEGTCKWRATDADHNVYKCMNPPFKNRRLRKTMEVCAFHLTECTAAHPSGSQPIAFPNAAALCVSHYTALHGREPLSYAGPLYCPGVVLARAGRSRHPLAPKHDPDEEDMPVDAVKGTGAAATAAGAAAGGGSSGPKVTEPEDAAAIAAAEEEAVRKLKRDRDRAAGGGLLTSLHSVMSSALKSRKAFRDALMRKPTGSTIETTSSATTASTGSGASGTTAATSGGSGVRALGGAGTGTAPGPAGSPAAPIVDDYSTPEGRAAAFKRHHRVVYDAPVVNKRYHRAATKIQALARMHFARRAVQRMKADRNRSRRTEAAVTLQRFFAMVAARSKFQRMYFSYHSAATRIQRGFRFYRYRQAVGRDRLYFNTATRIQKWFRVCRMQQRLHAVYERAVVQATAAMRRAALVKIRLFIRQWRMRRMMGDALLLARRQARAVLLLQRRWRKYQHQKKAVLAITGGTVFTKRMAIQFNAATLKIARFWRNLKFKWEARWDRQVTIKGIMNIQKIMRGMLARKRVREMLEQDEHARKYLAPGRTRVQVERLLAASGATAIRPSSPSAAGAASSTAGPQLDSSVLDWPSERTPRNFASTSLTSLSKTASTALRSAARKTGNTGLVPSSIGGAGAMFKRMGLTPSTADAAGAASGGAGTSMGRSGRSKLKVFTGTGNVTLADAAASAASVASGIAATAKSITGGPSAGSSSLVLRSGLTAKAAASAMFPKKAGTSKARTRVPEAAGRFLAGDEGRESHPDFIKLRAYIAGIEKDFLREDKMGVGVVTRACFNRVLFKHGLKASYGLMFKLQQTFLGPADCVSYVNYIAFARQLRYICPLHRVLVCPVCLFTGRCENCKCSAFKLDAKLRSDLMHLRARLCECGHHESRHIPSMRVHSETPVPLPDPLVLRLTLPRVSSLANELCGGLTNPKTYNPAISVEAFRSTLATEQAPITEEITSTLSSGATGLKGLEMAALAKAEREELAREAARPVMTPRTRKRLHLETLRANATQHIKKKFTVLEDWMDDMEQHTLTLEAREAAAIPAPTHEELAFAAAEEEIKTSRKRRASVDSLDSEPDNEHLTAADDFRMDGFTPGEAAAEYARKFEERRLEDTYIERVAQVMARPAAGSTIGGDPATVAAIFKVAADIHAAPAHRETAKTMVEYLKMMHKLQFPAPDGTDYIGNEDAMVDLLFHYNAFLWRWWRDLINDIRKGTVDGGPPAFTPRQRELMRKNRMPDEGRAAYYENVFNAFFELKIERKEATGFYARLASIAVKGRQKFGSAEHMHARPKNPARPLDYSRPSPYLVPLHLPGDPPRPASPPAKPATFATIGSENLAPKLPPITSAAKQKPVSMLSLAPETLVRQQVTLKETLSLPPMTAADAKRPGLRGVAPVPGVHPTAWRDAMLAETGALGTAHEAFECPYPMCGARFTTRDLVEAHMRLHMVKPVFSTASEADAYLLRMWDAVGVDGVVTKSAQAAAATAAAAAAGATR